VNSVVQLAGWVAWFVVPVAAASLATSWLIGWVSARGVLDVPNARSSHTRTTPRGGGIAIVAVVAWAAVVAAALWPGTLSALAGLIVPSLVLAAVSWLDDMRPLKNRVRFGMHVAAAAATIAVVGPVRALDLGSLGAVHLGAVAWPLTLLWIVGMTNAFNFMDGIDGIAGITAAVAGVAVATAAACLGVPSLTAVSLAFAGASIGFLTHNWPPARIFMGDVGSVFCGFLIAALPLVPGAPASERLVTITAVAMWPFIFDTAFTLCRRLSKGENIFEAHRSHLYQRLVIAGWPHRAVSTLYGSLSAIAASIAVAPLCGTASDRTATALAAAIIAVGSVTVVTLVHLASRPLPGNPSRFSGGR